MSSWLSELGYDYAQLVPEISRLDPRQRLTASLHSAAVETTTAAAAAADSVSTAPLVDCALRRADATVRRLPAVRRSGVVSPAAAARLRLRLAARPGIFGRAVVVSAAGRDGHLSVTVLDGADAERAALATTLFNGSRPVADLPPFSVHGRDVHHFVHASLQRAGDDLRSLGLELGDLSARVAGLNMTIHRGGGGGGGAGSPHVDVRLHGPSTWVAVRYGGSAAELRAHLLRRAGARAAGAAWAVERERAQSGKRRLAPGAWTRRQLDELLSRGHVTGYRPARVRDVIDRYPLLADDPYNVRFVRDGR